MSDEMNLEDQYKNIVEGQENQPPEISLGSVDMDKFKPAEAREAGRG